MPLPTLTGVYAFRQKGPFLAVCSIPDRWSDSMDINAIVHHDHIHNGIQMRILLSRESGDNVVVGSFVGT